MSNSIITRFILVLSTVVILYNYMNHDIEKINNCNNNKKEGIATTTIQQSKLGDGCYHIFLDVGSNIGIHARFLYEPDRYPESKSSVKAFSKEFGYPRDNRDYCVFSFEPNPKFEQRHLDLQEAYRAVGELFVLDYVCIYLYTFVVYVC